MGALGNYALVTGAYWAFTLTDGALRMLVLLHFHQLGFTPFELATLFLLYESTGIVTNFLGGWIGARFGLRVTLIAGLGVQIVALNMLSATDPAWTMAWSVTYVMLAQALSGIAKDLTKMSSKSAVKLVARGEGQLFRWVAMLTGSKNALKGVGFFLGGVLLSTLGFSAALWAMAAMLAVVLALILLAMTADLGRAKTKPRMRELFSKTRQINYLSAARIFLFAGRDVWFVVGVPVYLYQNAGWSFEAVAGFMALWVIGYGGVQAAVPKMLPRLGGPQDGAKAAVLWGGILLLLPAILALVLDPGLGTLPPWLLPSWVSAVNPSGVMGASGVSGVLITGLLIFGGLFAVNSAVHSYLIVAYSDGDKVALNVGFYYMANAAGRLLGTFLSGALYQWGGLSLTLWASAGLVLLATVLMLPVSRDAKRSQAV